MDELIAKLEAAKTESRELDAEIWEHVHGFAPTHCPHYTDSIDAALILVMEGWAWLANGQTDGHGWARIISPAENLSVSDYKDGTEGRTPALALCIAALKAHAYVKAGNDTSATPESEA